MYFHYLPLSLPLFHLSLFPHLVFLSPATLYSCSLSCSPLSGRLTRNDRASCHGVLEHTEHHLSAEGTTMAGMERRVRRANWDVLPSTHFCLCLNPIKGRLESSFLGWKSMSDSLCVQNVFFFPLSERAEMLIH